MSSTYVVGQPITGDGDGWDLAVRWDSSAEAHIVMPYKGRIVHDECVWMDVDREIDAAANEGIETLKVLFRVYLDAAAKMAAEVAADNA